MKYVEKVLSAVLLSLSLVGFNLMCAHIAAAQETVIHNFGPATTPDGIGPDAGLLIDGKGTLFGTTTSGGTFGAGTAFELSPVAGGGWTEQIIYNFSNVQESTITSVLIADAKGNLYGTTLNGGYTNYSGYSHGTVFELSRTADGSWSKTTLYDFGSFATDGTGPVGGLTLDGRGNLYGTTSSGGSNDLEYGSGDGTVFELTPSGGGTWTEKTLYSFGATSTDGTFPNGGVIFDAAGNLYGTTSAGGTSSDGTVFKLTINDGGSWTERIIHDFDVFSNFDGLSPEGRLVLDGKGNLYGTTIAGGAAGEGTVFEVSPAAGGAWTEKILFSFASDGYPMPTPNTTGIAPYTGLIMDAKGNLYGTTSAGGINSTEDYNGGTAFELVPRADGSWTETVLHSFPASASDGNYLSPGVVLDSAGNVYGTTAGGGAFGGGTVFEIRAVSAVTPVETGTTLASSPSFSANNPYYGPIAGEPITLSARVVSTVVGAVPTGSVTFTATTGGSITVPLTAGVAVYSGTVPSPGPYSIYARYNGGDGFAPSDSSTATALVSTHTITTLTSTPSTNLVSGGPITLTATVRSTIGKAIPTGTVTFVDLAGRMAFEPLVDGVAVYSGIVPSPGVFSIFASYSGATEFLESNSATLTRTVTAPSPQ